MKVAMVCDPGAGYRVDELARTLIGQGHRVAVWTAPPARADPLGRIGEFARFLDVCWGADPPDIVHAHSWASGVAAQLAARAHQLPVVQTFDTARPDAGPRDAQSKLERIVACNAEWVIATCTAQMSVLARLGRPRTRMSVVPRGVDLDTFTTTGPVAERGCRPRILAVGRTLPHQGFDTVIKALPAIAEADFVIAGGPESSRLDDDPEVRRLQALAGRIGVAARVMFTGRVPRADMPALLRSADVLTCTARDGSFGVVSVEAMACGIPVVASAAGGMSDTVVHEVTGRLVDPHRPRECAAAVSGILHDSFLRRGLGMAGRDRAVARYSRDRVGEETLRVYDRCLRTAPQRV